MGGIKGNIKEIGLIFRDTFDEVPSFLAYQIGGIAILNKWSVAAMPVGLTIAYVGKIIDRPIVMAMKMRKTLIIWVPFWVITVALGYLIAPRMPPGRALGNREAGQEKREKRGGREERIRRRDEG